jgi:methylated-DNA-[protein]-cysteine S-methyltransferase
MRMTAAVPTSALWYRRIDSPIGGLLLAGDGRVLHRLAFAGDREPTPESDWSPDVTGKLDPVCRELEAYFAGRLTRFATPVAPRGTPFQQRVWAALCDIPYGRTTSYGALARQIGVDKAVRAVGAANGANPIAILVPCHRVIGADGSLTGFGGGLPVKRALLDLEQGTRRLI